MALYNFKKRFAPAILSGEKRHTIRAKRKYMTEPGELLHLYTGLRQKGATLLMRVHCTKVENIQIDSAGNISIDGVTLELHEADQLARCDGFKDYIDMMAFWSGRLPFWGDIIHWEFPSTLLTQSGDIDASVPTARLRENCSGNSTILFKGMPHQRAQRRTAAVTIRHPRREKTLSNLFTKSKV